MFLVKICKKKYYESHLKSYAIRSINIYAELFKQTIIDARQNISNTDDKDIESKSNIDSKETETKKIKKTKKKTNTKKVINKKEEKKDTKKIKK